MKRLVSLCAVVAGLAFTLSGTTGRAQQPADRDVDFVANEMLVQYAPGASAQAKASARAGVRAQAIETIVDARRRDDGHGDLELVRIPPGLAVANAVPGIQGSDVEFAEPNFIYTRSDQ